MRACEERPVAPPNGGHLHHGQSAPGLPAHEPVKNCPKCPAISHGVGRILSWLRCRLYFFLSNLPDLPSSLSPQAIDRFSSSSSSSSHYTIYAKLHPPHAHIRQRWFNPPRNGSTHFSSSSHTTPSAADPDQSWPTSSDDTRAHGTHIHATKKRDTLYTRYSLSAKRSWVIFSSWPGPWPASSILSQAPLFAIFHPNSPPSFSWPLQVSSLARAGIALASVLCVAC